MSNLFSIVSCSICPGRTLLKTALIWNQSVFCSPECLRTFVDNDSQKREPQLKESRDKFFRPVSRLSDTQAVQAVVDDRQTNRISYG